MKAQILILVLCVFGALANYTEQEYKAAYSNWMQIHGKAYTSEVFQIRYMIFKSNMDFVDSWNADPTHTHTVELNQFADISNAEFQSIYLGTRLSFPELVVNTTTAPLPTNDNINWAAKGAVTPIKNQGQCGSCWSFSTTGSVEGLNQIYTGRLISLSEQNLMDCSPGNDGCNGGSMDLAFQYIQNNGGIDTEASYPYRAAKGSCAYNPQNSGASIGGYTDIGSGDEGGLTNAINVRPVSIAIDASQQSFQLYQKGVYYEPACSTTRLDHGVLAIGYGTDTEFGSGAEYYIVKNSWGTGWGMQGYIWMSRNRGNNCGIATAASYPNPR